LIGGFALIIGAFVTIISIPLIISMLVAMFTVNVRYGFSAIKTLGLNESGPIFGPPGYEINLLYIAGLLILSSRERAHCRSIDGFNVGTEYQTPDRIFRRPTHFYCRNARGAPQCALSARLPNFISLDANSGVFPERCIERSRRLLRSGIAA
jgi:hypothetical protein